MCRTAAAQRTEGSGVLLQQGAARENNGRARSRVLLRWRRQVLT
jgi:hypothetical protein